MIWKNPRTLLTVYTRKYVKVNVCCNVIFATTLASFYSRFQKIFPHLINRCFRHLHRSLHHPLSLLRKASFFFSLSSLVFIFLYLFFLIYFFNFFNSHLDLPIWFLLCFYPRTMIIFINNVVHHAHIIHTFLNGLDKTTQTSLHLDPYYE